MSDQKVSHKNEKKWRDSLNKGRIKIECFTRFGYATHFGIIPTHINCEYGSKCYTFECLRCHKEISGNADVKNTCKICQKTWCYKCDKEKFDKNFYPYTLECCQKKK